MITIVDMKMIAKDSGGQCLSSEYLNNSSKLIWKCKNGHIWEATPKNIKKGRWCPFCVGKYLTIEEMQNRAKKFKGKCLSKEYINAKEKLQWQCRVGHVWLATPDSIKSGNWCPHCAGNAKKSIDDMKILAQERNGKCLSKSYVNAHSLLKWRCEFGHVWEAASTNVIKGSWCPFCSVEKISSSQRLDLSTLIKVATKKGGSLLSTEYLNNRSKLIWRCAEDHEFEMSAGLVRRGAWCSICSGNLIDTIENMQKIAKERFGECLSRKYINARKKLKWRCNLGHTWSATPTNIKRGQWCPDCSKGLSERICRAYFEQLLGKKFPISYPNWLKIDGRQLQLDGYCAALNLAFEHHGVQHYREIDFFHRTKYAFKRSRIYDDEKKRLCKLHGVILIEVPALFVRVKLEDLRAYVLEQLGLNGYKVPAKNRNKEIDFSGVYSLDKLNKYREYLAELDYKLITKYYLGASQKHVHECPFGHRWESSPNRVQRRGQGCPVCVYAKSNALTFDGIVGLHEFAMQKGGKCLSKLRRSFNSKLSWQCNEGHTWEAYFANLIYGSWCQKCNNLKKRIK
jgi:hypothetical protein